MFTIWKEHHLKDFTVVEKTNDEDGEMTIIALTSTNDQGQSHILMMNYPSFEEICMLPVSEQCCLIQSLDDNEDVVFIECIKSVNGIIDQLRIKVRRSKCFLVCI